jgi:hypothetical protein
MAFGYHTGHLWHLFLHPVRNFWSADAKIIVLETVNVSDLGWHPLRKRSCTCSEGI